MAKKRPPVRRSFYGFSKEYPDGNAQSGYRRSENKKQRRREHAVRLLKAGGLLCLFLVGYFLTTLALDISNRPIPVETLPSGEETPPSSGEPSEGGVTPPAPTELRAVYLPETLSGDVLGALLEQAAAAQINAVVIDFKRADGTLSYASALEQAAQAGAIQSTNANLPQMLAACKEKGMLVIGRISCFRDPLAAKSLDGGNAAVHYGTSGGLWLDNRAESGGKPWLNPYSETARAYLAAVVGEVRGLGADRILLDAVQYPQAYSLDKATFEGERESAVSRNATLLSFIGMAQDAAGGADRLIVSMTGDGALNADAMLYDGSLFDSSASVLAPDLRLSELPASVKLNGAALAPKSDFPAFLSAAGAQLAARASVGGRTTTVMAILQADSAASVPISAQLETLRTAGIKNYILYQEKGNYTFS